MDDKNRLKIGELLLSNHLMNGPQFHGSIAIQKRSGKKRREIFKQNNDIAQRLLIDFFSYQKKKNKVLAGYLSEAYISTVTHLENDAKAVPKARLLLKRGPGCYFK